MKNFVRKTFVVALMVLPLLSHAGERDCGGGTITAIEENYLGRGFTAFSVQQGASHPFVSTYGGHMLVHTNAQEAYESSVNLEKAKLLRSTLLAAFHAGSYVRFKSNTDVYPNCWDVTQARVCKDEASCY